jgi:hypothetical protein
MSGRLTWRLVACMTFTLRNGSRQNLEDHPKVVLTGALFHACPGDLDALAMQLPSSACYIAWMAGICCIVWLPRSWSKLIKAQLFSYSNCILTYFAVSYSDYYSHRSSHSSPVNYTILLRSLWFCPRPQAKPVQRAPETVFCAPSCPFESFNVTMDLQDHLNLSGAQAPNKLATA